MKDGDAFQLDLVHAIRDTSFNLWGEKMPLNQRKEISGRMGSTLRELVNSVKKHREDGDRRAIGVRVEQTLIELYNLSGVLKKRG
jgi:hypothetical protein